MHKYRELAPLAQIHDAAYFECWEEDVQRLMVDVKQDFEHEETRDGRTIKFPVKVKQGVSLDLL